MTEPGRLNGVVDRIVRPRSLLGWVVHSERQGLGRDITLTVRLDGRVIGEGRPEHSRHDGPDQAGYLTGFRLTCTEDIPDEAIAFEQIEIEARNEAGLTGRVSIYDFERAIALNILLRAAPPLGRHGVAVLLTGLAQSPALSPELQQSLHDLHDRSFGPNAAQPAAKPATDEVLADPTPETDDRELMFQFESLGKNCVLGGIQRAFGAEPLGLLRFAGIDTERVTEALRNRFAGVGSAEFTRLEPNEQGEYFSFDSRYHMSSHTFVFEGQVAFEQFFKQQCRKIAFLAANLLQKIEEGERIFVIHAIPGSIPEEKLQAVYEALRAIGTAPLLYVQEASAEYPPGTVWRRPDGILSGYVLRPGEELMKPAKEMRDSWLAVCRKAYTMNQELTAGQVAETAK